jgi:hypothetical protein
MKVSVVSVNDALKTATTPGAADKVVVTFN